MSKAGFPAGRLDRFKTCGSQSRVIKKPIDSAEGNYTYKVSANYCRDRFCVRCGRVKQCIAANAILRAVEGKTIRFLTLTLAHTQTPLTNQIDRLLTCFRRLRQRTFWSDHVVGGIAVIEIKIGQDNKWHVHLHALIEGVYMPQRQLSAEWLSVTGDSSIVHIAPCGEDKNGRIRYVSKYLGKPADGEMFEPGREQYLQELLRALTGRRLWMKFGTLHGADLDGDDPDMTGWEVVGRLDEIVTKARSGCIIEQGILNALKRSSLYDEASKPPDDGPHGADG